MSCKITDLFVTDLQMVNISLRVLARPDQTFLPMIYRQIGTDYDERVLPSICNEVFSSVFSSPELQARAFLINILLLSVIIIVVLVIYLLPSSPTWPNSTELLLLLSSLSSTFHISVGFSRTTGLISTKLGTKHP